MRVREERQLSEQYSSLVNKAYSTLAQPLSRGLYMLSMRDVYLEEGITATDPQFLTKILEINEELADAQPDDVKKLERNNKEMLDKLTREAAVAFSTGDINTAKQVLVKMKYYSSFEARIKNLKRESGIE
ncbi:hypothetical protein ANN_16024 [Periplaneta americana]|uniref:Co-chaperone HscB C-terminal oligomerisation domain-containing protein n=1 Tax=Periplaneta americana TaxID=6978 RepID=A0ABQ8SI33_PERAM|nr:hypothetical protein ANN_16024 [Periplaneta americana]